MTLVNNMHSTHPKYHLYQAEHVDKLIMCVYNF